MRVPLCVVLSEDAVQVLSFPFVNQDDDGLIDYIAMPTLPLFVEEAAGPFMDPCALALLILLSGHSDSGVEKLIIKDGVPKRKYTDSERTGGRTEQKDRGTG